MKNITTPTPSVDTADEEAAFLFDDWVDPIEAAVRQQVRGFIERLMHEELEAALRRARYGRAPKTGEAASAAGHRHGHRTRHLTGTFGKTELSVPRARLDAGDGRTKEWKSSSLRAYQRRTKAADAVIASAYLAGVNTRRVWRALASLFDGAISKDTVNGLECLEQPLARG